MNEEKRRFPRTDRPGSGIYQGESSPGVAFDDYRASDETEIHHRHSRRGAWRGFLDFLLSGLFPLANDQIVAKAEAALARDPTLDTSHVRIWADGGTVTVKGSVPTRWMKERISDYLLELAGVSSIQNELQVKPEHNKLPQEGSITA
jgi:hypothetical protein